MRFKPGQEVVCLDGSKWEFQNQFTGFWFWKKRKKAIGPKTNELCMVTAVPHEGYIRLKGYPQDQQYVEMWFAPVADISELVEVLQAEHQV